MKRMNERQTLKAASKGYLYVRDVNFLYSIGRNKNLTPKQKEWLKSINERVRNKTIVLSDSNSDASGKTLV